MGRRAHRVRTPYQMWIQNHLFKNVQLRMGTGGLGLLLLPFVPLVRGQH